MADDEFGNNKYLKALDSSSGTGAPTAFNYDAFLADVGKIAGQTRQVSMPDPSAYLKEMERSFQPKYTPAGKEQRALAGSAVQDWRTQGEVMKKRASKAATAMETKAASTAQGLQNIEALQAQFGTEKTKAETLWSQAAEQAGEYVEETKLRTTQSLNQIDRLFEDMKTGRDFAKAHASQAAVQATLGAMDAEEKAIRQSAKSPEDLQRKLQTFNQKKQMALGKVQSEIEVGYQNIVEQANQNYLNARADLTQRMHMYTGFQEQQHVETLVGMAKSGQAYSLAESQFQLTAEQLKMAGLNEFSDWMMSVPDFGMELGDLMATMVEIRNMYWGGPRYFIPTTVNLPTQAAAHLSGLSQPAPGRTLHPNYSPVEGFNPAGRMGVSSYSTVKP